MKIDESIGHYKFITENFLKYYRDYLILCPHVPPRTMIQLYDTLQTATREYSEKINHNTNPRTPETSQTRKQPHCEIK